MEYGVPTKLVCLALVVVQIGFGGYGVIVKKFAANNEANPLVFCFIRDGICWLVLLLCAVVSERKLNLPHLKELPLFFLMGMFGMFGNQLFYIMGVYYAGADISSIFQPAIPVWTALLAIITRVEKPPSLKRLHGWAKIFGITFAVGGAVTMLTTKLTDTKTSSSSTLNKSHHSGFKTILGIIFLFANTICMAIYILIQKHYIFNRPTLRWSQYPVSVTAWCYFFGTLCMAIASFYYVGKCPHVGACKDDPWHIPKEEAIPLVYAIFIASALCYMLITWGNMHVSPSVVTAFWPLQVPVAVVSSYFFLGERLTPPDYGGGGLIIVGLLLVVYSNWYSEKSQKEKSVASLVFGRTEQERQALLSSQTLHKTNNDDVFDSTLQPKSFAAVNNQQH